MEHNDGISSRMSVLAFGCTKAAFVDVMGEVAAPIMLRDSWIIGLPGVSSFPVSLSVKSFSW